MVDMGEFEPIRDVTVLQFMNEQLSRNVNGFVYLPPVFLRCKTTLLSRLTLSVGSLWASTSGPSSILQSLHTGLVGRAVCALAAPRIIEQPLRASRSPLVQPRLLVPLVANPHSLGRAERKQASRPPHPPIKPWKAIHSIGTWRKRQIFPIAVLRTFVSRGGDLGCLMSIQ